LAATFRFAEQDPVLTQYIDQSRFSFAHPKKRSGGVRRSRILTAHCAVVCCQPRHLFHTAPVSGSAFCMPLMENAGMLDLEEESLPTANLLDDQVFAQSLAARCESARIRSLLEIAESDRPIKLWPGEAVEAAILRGPPIYAAVHSWHGSRLTCTELTSPLVLPNRPCPICVAKRSNIGEVWADDWRIQTRFRIFIPCAVEASLIAESEWRVWGDRFAALLETDDDFCAEWRLGQFAVGAAHRIERFQSVAGVWGWNIAPIADSKPVKRAELRALRNSMPGVLVPYPDPKETAKFVDVARANWLNSPVPGRAEELLDALPGALLVPCCFAGKGTKVKWADGAWSAALMDEYGAKRLNKGNLAVLLGPPSDGLATIDWDTDRFDAEFLSRNPWAVTCMRSWASRPPGNYWFRIRGLPDSLARVFKLRAEDDDVGELRLGRCITVISGAHPSGAVYKIKNLGQIPEITLEQIVWPDGVAAAARNSCPPPSQPCDWDVHDAECQPCIDLSQVEGVRPHPSVPGALHGRCPVCAKQNKDRRHEHLIVYANGRWTTRGTCGHDHSKIYALIGRSKHGKRKAHHQPGSFWCAFTKL